MRKLQEVTIVEEVVVEGLGGFAELFGQYIYVCCSGYAYAGRLVAYNADEIQLTDTCIVYETGKWLPTLQKWKISNSLSNPGLPKAIMIKNIESYFLIAKSEALQPDNPDCTNLLNNLLGKTVYVGTSGYSYKGRLVGINTTEIQLSDAAIVYDVEWAADKPGWLCAEELPYLSLPKNIRLAQVEIYFEI